MLLITVPVDPRKDATSKWLFWLIGPMVSATLFAIAFYGSMKNPETTDRSGKFRPPALGGHAHHPEH